MRFDLDDLNPGIWVDHPIHDARIQLRALTVEELEKIRKKTVKTKLEFKRGQRFEVDVTDEQESQKLTWDYCIVDWENILDGNGNPMECNTENKLLLMRRSAKFASWVTDSLAMVTDDHVERQESAEKNLLNSQSDGQKNQIVKSAKK